MSWSKTLAGALVGAVLGCAVWTGVAWLTGYELGILAIGLGLTCGIGAAMGAQGRAGTAGGVIAACTAMIAIVVSRSIIVEIAINQMVSEAIAQSTNEIPGPEDDEYWIAFIGDQIIEREGGATDWADSDDPDESVASFYPPEVWAKAQARWSSMSSADKQEFCAAGSSMVAKQTAEGIDSFRTVAGVIGMVWSNLHPMSLFIMGLAMFTAFRTARSARPVDANAEMPNGGTMMIDNNMAAPPQASPMPTAGSFEQRQANPTVASPTPVRPKAPPAPTALPSQETSEQWIPPWMRK